MLYRVTSLFVILFISSCGGGGGSSSSAPAPSPQTPATLTGVFVDSPVAGLAYSSPSNSGLTNASGEFQYRSGETVTFSLGDITLGSVTGAAMVSPIDLAGANSIDEARQLGRYDQVVNTVILLQSLDLDGNPDNGINLGDLNSQIANSSLDLTLATQAFADGNYRELINVVGGRYVTPRSAVNHLLATLGESVSVSLVSNQSLDIDGNGVNDIATQFEYDEAGRVIGISTNTDREAVITYNDAGLLRSITEGSNVESFEYDNQDRLTTRSFEVNGELFSSTSFEYDGVGNIIRESVLSSSSLFGQAFGLYYTEFLLLARAPVILPPDLITDLLRGGLNGDVVDAGVIGNGVFDLTTTPILIGGSAPRETATEYEYFPDGRIRQIRQTGFINFLATFNEAENCLEAEAGGFPAFSGSPLPISGSLSRSNLNFCNSVNTPETIRDSMGRVTRITIDSRASSNANFIGVLSVSTFEYSGGNLVLQETTVTRAGATTPDFVARTEFGYNSFGDLTSRVTSQNGETTSVLMRDYERRVLSALP